MNPILKSRSNLILYILAWITISAVQAGVLIVNTSMGVFATST